MDSVPAGPTPLQMLNLRREPNLHHESDVMIPPNPSSVWLDSYKISRLHRFRTFRMTSDDAKWNASRAQPYYGAEPSRAEPSAVHVRTGQAKL